MKRFTIWFTVVMAVFALLITSAQATTANVSDTAGWKYNTTLADVMRHKNEYGRVTPYSTGWFYINSESSMVIDYKVKCPTARELRYDFRLYHKLDNTTVYDRWTHLAYGITTTGNRERKWYEGGHWYKLTTQVSDPLCSFVETVWRASKYEFIIGS